MKKIVSITLITCIVLAGLLISGCTDNKTSTGNTISPFTPPETVEDVSIAEVLSDPFAYNNIRITGTVNQTLDVSGYTYMELTDENKSIWVAGYSTSLENGTEVTATGSLMINFPSTSLGRTFEVLLMADSVSDGSSTTTSDSPHGSASNTVVINDINVTPVEGSTQISDIISNAESLKGQEIKVTAVVAKSTPLISELFLTLDDGTGQLKARCPNSFVVSGGDNVVVTGIVRTDVDLGSGYYYEVLLDVTNVE
ncbi:MAG: hypothetical protein SCH39_03700 [Methanosarcinales archaeon]|nr:hypothetical protein [ANME-2 cluster archaeon]MDF1531972.1 hypothetical protein [ANME-2 cluster archaeon]MDW7775427.1 hypothetical protein [Methanosarcinales archaeon]